MMVPAREQGSALLTVLLLVAVMATLAATALDRISVGTRLAGNAATVGQGRAWLATAEMLAATKIEDLLAADDAQTILAGGWAGVERSISLPDGAVVRTRIEDGGNCFNLNSLVQPRAGGSLDTRPIGQSQFTALMMLVGIGEGDAARIAASTADYIDSDSTPLAGGAEDTDAGLTANRMMAHPSELRSVPGVTDRYYRLLRPWICTLPIAELSPINVNTLLPEQAPLLAMLVPGKLDAARARALIATRPADGYGSIVSFWGLPALAALQAHSDVTQQTKVRTTFFKLRAEVDSGATTLSETALIDARRPPARVISRSFGEEG